jgi:hypothetical protein
MIFNKGGNAFIGEDMRHMIRGALANTNSLNLRKNNLIKNHALSLPTHFWIWC